MGNVRKHGKNWQLIYQHNGQRHWETVHVKDKTEAIRMLKIREGKAVDPRKSPELAAPPSFEELAAGVETDYKINRRWTLKDLRLRLKHLREHLGGLNAAEITAPTVQKYIDNRQSEGAANRSINRGLAGLKRMLNLAVKRLRERRCGPATVWLLSLSESCTSVLEA